AALPGAALPAAALAGAAVVGLLPPLWVPQPASSATSTAATPTLRMYPSSPHRSSNRPRSVLRPFCRSGLGSTGAQGAGPDVPGCPEDPRYARVVRRDGAGYPAGRSDP